MLQKTKVRVHDREQKVRNGSMDHVKGRLWVRAIV